MAAVKVKRGSYIYIYMYKKNVPFHLDDRDAINNERNCVKMVRLVARSTRRFSSEIN